MGRPKSWTEHRGQGVLTITLSSWRYFDDFVNQRLGEYTQYIFRGQASSKWKLESTLHRLFKKSSMPHNEANIKKHLRYFKLATRGRIETIFNDSTSDNEWWALGQHYGLATPLLDWTVSPFVAAYFAFIPEINDSDDFRTIWALQHVSVSKQSKILTANPNFPENEIINTFIPTLSGNNRLVSQGGLFTDGPISNDIEAWVRLNFADSLKGHLIKINVPNNDRQISLRHLNRMNINHNSLFPDLYGAAKSANMRLALPKYAATI